MSYDSTSSKGVVFGFVKEKLHITNAGSIETGSSFFYKKEHPNERVGTGNSSFRELSGSTINTGNT
jgi:hypothetical protein